MRKFVKQVSQKRGLAPGTPVHIGEKSARRIQMGVIDYTPEGVEEKQLREPEACRGFKESPGVSWINVDGVHDPALLEKLGECFELHPLVVEDMANTAQRPKYEEGEGYIFIVLRMLYCKDNHSFEIVSEQVSLILGPSFVLSFQEKEGDVFDPVRLRIRNAKSRIRQAGADYLAYALLDAVVDNYFVVLEKLAEKIEALEEEILTEPGEHTLQTIHTLKRELIYLRKSVWPLREVAGGLQRLESPLICEQTALFLKDVYDHAIQVIDTIENFRDMVTGMLDIYLSSVSNRMNEVMKTLTIIATIFIPLTFVAGIYGMNFKYIPELEWRWGYGAVWAVNVLVAVLMVRFFKKKGWL